MFALNDNRNKAMSDSIVTFDVGGKILTTLNMEDEPMKNHGQSKKVHISFIII